MESLLIGILITAAVIIIFLIIAAVSNGNEATEAQKETKRIEEYYKEKLDEALNQIVENSKKPFMIWIVNKYTEKDMLLFWKNLEFVHSVMKYLEYEIAVNTDTMRNTDDGGSTREKIWYANALHTTYRFFHKIANKTDVKEEYTWKELV